MDIPALLIAPTNSSASAIPSSVGGNELSAIAITARCSGLLSAPVAAQASLILAAKTAGSSISSESIFTALTNELAALGITTSAL